MSRPITDTSWTGLFRHGFDRAIDEWLAGNTAEGVSHNAPKGTPVGRGMVAACEMILGWHDIAEREACFYGMSRDEARQFVAEKAAAVLAKVEGRVAP